MKSEHILQVEIGGYHGKTVFRIFDQEQWFVAEVNHINKLRQCIDQWEKDWLRSWLRWLPKMQEGSSSHRMREYLLDHLNCSGSFGICVTVLKSGQFVPAGPKEVEAIERLLIFTDYPILLSVSTAPALTAPSGIHLTQAAI